jgi:ferrochelatase
MDLTNNRQASDAVFMVAFGGPEQPEDVLPFLTRVTQGRVPPARLEMVARHYEIFGGKSPVNEVTCNQAKALEKALKEKGVSLPVYVGMRHWKPFMEDTLVQMRHDGIQQAVCIIMSVFQSRSSWDQYQTEVAHFAAKEGSNVNVTYARPFFEHPGFFKTVSAEILKCMAHIPPEERQATCILFSVHSLPHSDPGVDLYVEQIHRSATLVSHELHHSYWQIAYQSRSGRPQDPWLEPDINHVLIEMGNRGEKNVIVVPIGFVCDNVEVLYDLDTQAKKTARDAGISFFRAKTVGVDPAFIDALAEGVMAVDSP